MTLQPEDYYLELSENPIRFDAVSQLTNVFFDDTNGQVFAVRSGGVTGVIVKGPDQKTCTTFRMEDKGPVISIKFSPDLSVLAVQRSHTSVDFMNFENLVPTTAEYSQSSKWKNGTLLGFVWTKINEIAFVTNHGIELLQVIPEKKQLKTLKTTTISGSWFSWCARSKLAVLAGDNVNYLHPYILNNSTITKLPRVEMEGSRALSERDVWCARLYGRCWCLVLRHGGDCPAEVLALPLETRGGNETSSKEGKGHILRTGLTGRFAFNVVDDLVVVHHQASKTSMLFDILEDGTIEGNNIIHFPIATPKSLKSFSLPDQPCQMYSGTWVAFQPDIIIDARLGCLWHIVLKPSGLLCTKPEKIVSVLLRRTEGRAPIYDILKDLTAEGGKNLAQLMQIFDLINAVYRKWGDQEMSKQMGQTFNQSSESKVIPTYTPRVIITQQDIYTNVLQYHTDSSHIVQVVISYLCSLAKHGLSSQHALTEMLVRALVRENRFSDLHQLLQYSAIGDSKPLACLLLSLANLHPAAHQLALDMLHRLNAHEEAVEVLLGGGEVIAGVGVAKQYSPLQPSTQMQAGNLSVWNSLPARKLLSAAQHDAGTFISVYHALENRNRATRNTPCFFKGEKCEPYYQLYISLFPEVLDR